MAIARFANQGILFPSTTISKIYVGTEDDNVNFETTDNATDGDAGADAPVPYLCGLPHAVFCDQRDQ